MKAGTTVMDFCLDKPFHPSDPNLVFRTQITRSANFLVFDELLEFNV